MKPVGVAATWRAKAFCTARAQPSHLGDPRRAQIGIVKVREGVIDRIARWLCLARDSAKACHPGKTGQHVIDTVFEPVEFCALGPKAFQHSAE